MSFGSYSNLPPGTWEGDPRAPWNQDEAPECPECGEPVTPGEECEECGEYMLTDEDHAEAAAEAKFEMMREEHWLPDDHLDDPDR